MHQGSESLLFLQCADRAGLCITLQRDDCFERLAERTTLLELTLKHLRTGSGVVTVACDQQVNDRGLWNRRLASQARSLSSTVHLMQTHFRQCAALQAAIRVAQHLVVIEQPQAQPRQITCHRVDRPQQAPCQHQAPITSAAVPQTPSGAEGIEHKCAANHG